MLTVSGLVCMTWAYSQRVFARLKPGGTAKIVNRDSVDARLGETLGKLAMEREQAAHVWHDDDGGVGWREGIAMRGEGVEAGTIKRQEHQLFGAHRQTVVRRDRWL